MAVAKIHDGLYVVYNIRDKASLDASLKAILLLLKDDPSKRVRIYLPRTKLTKDIDRKWIKVLKERYPGRAYSFPKYGIKIVKLAPGIIEFYGIVRSDTEINLARSILRNMIIEDIRKGVKTFDIILPKGKPKYVAKLIKVITDLKGRIMKSYGPITLNLKRLRA